MADIRVTAQITAFTGPDENPLSEGGTWTRTVFDAGNDPLKREGNIATDSVHGSVDYSHYTGGVFDSDDGIIEVWAHPVGGGLGAALESWRVALWTEGSTPGSVAGYLFLFGGGIGEEYILRRYDGFPSNTQIDNDDTFPPDYLMLRIDGSEIQGWTSGDEGANWTMIVSATDTTYRGTFYLGLGIEDPTGGGLGFNGFGGGIEEEFVPQIYRRPNE